MALQEALKMASEIRKRGVVSHPIPELTPRRSAAGPQARRAPQGVRPGQALALLVAARLVSAFLNIIHDCDETFNYLEPLHYLLNGYGMQTWEYSAEFALRPYLYLLLHAVVGAPAAAIAGAGEGKVAVFYAIKVALALASALTEWWLYRAVWRRYRAPVANAFLALLCLSTGMFVSSTGMLPSSFTMYALTAAAAGMLAGRPHRVVAAAVVGVVWGWCVAGAAFLPYALWVLVAANFFSAFGTLVLCLLGTVVPLALLDRLFYGRWTASLWNFVRYNVVGGGDSALYGVEGPAFYFRNGFNNFTLALPLALALPVLAGLAGGALPLGLPSKGGARAAERWSTLRLLTCVSPLYVWLALISKLPHKEERFLFVAYPLLCLAAAASLATLADWAARVLSSVIPPRTAQALAKLGSRAVLGVVGVLALSRSAALVLNYGAPLQIYKHLPELPAGAPLQYVCTGAEWHRFPSAFFLPGLSYRLQFIKSGFDGLLPRPFDPEQGGTAAAPRQFNTRNREEPENYWDTPERCAYLVTLREGGKALDNLGGLEWEDVVSRPFVDVARSPALARAFYIPGWSPRQNHYVEYVLLRRRQAT